MCITEKYIKNFTLTTVSGHNTYSGITKLRHGKAFFRSFNGANAKQLRYYIIPILIDDKPDAIVIHVGTNDILNHANHEDIARSIINIGLDCKNNGVNEVFISSISVKKNLNLRAIVRRVNDIC